MNYDFLKKYFNYILLSASFIIYLTIMVPYFTEYNIRIQAFDTNFWVMYLIALLGLLPFILLTVMVSLFKQVKNKNIIVPYLSIISSIGLFLLIALILKYINFSIDTKMNLLLCSYFFIILVNLFIMTLDGIEEKIIALSNKIIILCLIIFFIFTLIQFFDNGGKKEILKYLFNRFSIGQYEGMLHPKKEICTNLHICSKKYFILWNNDKSVSFIDHNKTKTLSKRNLLLSDPVR